MDSNYHVLGDRLTMVQKSLFFRFEASDKTTAEHQLAIVDLQSKLQMIAVALERSWTPAPQAAPAPAPAP